MTIHSNPLPDGEARRTVLTALDRTLLVEAGAGSGKTALMAGRVVSLVASGVHPRAIAAITFTELAASELVARVRDYAERILADDIPDELAIAAGAFSADALDRLRAGVSALDELTCSTIHGFCQSLVKPFPAEARIDPGARILDADEAKRMFEDALSDWLRQRLSDPSSSPLVTELVLADDGEALSTIDDLAHVMRGVLRPTAPPSGQHRAAAAVLRTQVESLLRTLSGIPYHEQKTQAAADALARVLAEVNAALAHPDPVCAIRLTCVEAGSTLLTSGGTPRKLQAKGAWEAAASKAGRSKAEGAAFCQAIVGQYDSCMSAFMAVRTQAASSVQSALVAELGTLLDAFAERKRRSAVVDFDDLIVSARDLLKHCAEPRRVLSERFRHVLVDEFQDTDPAQAEIVWRLCGEPEAAGNEDWRSIPIRPGALFVVGDPKQAIYRFRGADVATYLTLRSALEQADPASILSVSANFRSCEPILAFANDRFAAPLSAAGQPGFVALSASISDHGRGPCVAAIEVSYDDGPDAGVRRSAEARAVAALCAELIGVASVRSSARETRPCRPGDIALLAPSGAELWRYEEALEALGIPVATQAGKGFFLRQEVQDLVALARVLADPNDAFAIGAFLRGPVVGLTDEDLLDIVEEMAAAAEPDTMPRLRLARDHGPIRNPIARTAMDNLAVLQRNALTTSPHRALSEAVELFRMRGVVAARYEGRAERALANVDLFLELAKPFAVRGMRAFADWAYASWSGRSRTIEGRPDAQQEAISLITMHSAKGLEWPIVIPVNTWTEIEAPKVPVVDKASGEVHAKILGVATDGLDGALAAEKAQAELERVRLWYVAATRARDYLILPRHTDPPTPGAWGGVVDLKIADLPLVDVPASATATVGTSDRITSQDASTFQAQAAHMGSVTPKTIFVAPSRAEAEDLPAERPRLVFADGDDGSATAAEASPQGGRLRGSIIHKLLEEALSGAIDDDVAHLERRAGELLATAPASEAEVATIAPAEVAHVVSRTLRIPEIIDLRPRLHPELPVHAKGSAHESDEILVSGIADAVAFAADGRPEVVIDWKTDVDPQDVVVVGYVQQVREYKTALQAQRGLVVLVTAGRIVEA